MTRVAALVGPTAVGKSALAVDVARALRAEVVSVDSMQVYRGMDIGTDKVAAQVRAGVPHHLVDVFPASHAVTVAEYQRLARAAIADIASRGRLPLLVGGSGLYFRAVVDGLDFPARSSEVRASLEGEARRIGARALYERLERVDPEAALRIEPTNARRIVRALEAIEVGGQAFSSGRVWERYESSYDLRVAGITRPRAELYERIARRVERMLDAGLVAEVERLSEEGLGVTARQAVGYRQVLADPGAPASRLGDAIVAATKRLARRQESWFRADPRVVWFDAGARDARECVAAFLAGAVTAPARPGR